ncbi:MAG: FmdB family zinc ribbon protein [Planctomycetota bacterium]|jgi:putative FmdB family regulatory protein
MPIYEFKCSKCNAFFEELVNSDTKVECPECKSKKIEKQFSTFATSDSDNSAQPECFHGGCNPGRCGSGRCGIE